MTALDQAFIKAYMHQDSAPVATSLGSARPVRLAEALADPPKPAPSEPSAEAISESRAAAVTQALENPPVRARKEAVLRARAESAEALEAPRRPNSSPLWASKAGPKAKSPASDPAAKPSAVAVSKAATSPSLEALGIPPRTLPARPTASESVAPAVEPLPAAEPTDPPPAPAASKTHTVVEFRPAFQVDRFVWPSGCTRLSAAAASQLDSLAEAMTAHRSPSQGAVGVCGCRRGDGCTTLLMCVARRLASQGKRVLLFDADFDQPVLARRLGLLPELGWEDVLWRGVSLSEAVIESVEDGLAVLPLRGAVPVDTTAGAGSVDPVGDMELLRRQYDLVLIDLGRFDCSSQRAAAVLQTARHWIDSVVVVQNIRTTPQTEVDYLRRRLRETGLAEAGIAENFA